MAITDFCALGAAGGVSGRMAAAMQLLEELEQGAGLNPDCYCLDGAPPVLRRCAAETAPGSRYLPPAWSEDSTRAAGCYTLGLLLFALFTGEDPELALDLSFHALRRIASDEGADACVLTPADFRPMTRRFPECEALVPALVRLTSFQPAAREEALRSLREQLLASPCDYHVCFCSEDGTAQTETDLSVQPPERIWPEQEPVGRLTLSDGKEYLFPVLRLPFRPGKHTIKHVASQVLDAQPAPAPTAPKKEAKPAPAPICISEGGALRLQGTLGIVTARREFLPLIRSGAVCGAEDASAETALNFASDDAAACEIPLFLRAPDSSMQMLPARKKNSPFRRIAVLVIDQLPKEHLLQHQVKLQLRLDAEGALFFSGQVIDKRGNPVGNRFSGDVLP